jgi:hypothetical protein
MDDNVISFLNRKKKWQEGIPTPSEVTFSVCYGAHEGPSVEEYDDEELIDIVLDENEKLKSLALVLGTATAILSVISALLIAKL